MIVIKGDKMSKLGKSLVLIALVGALLAACASQPAATPVPVTPQGNNPYATQLGDEAMTRGDAEIVSAPVAMMARLSAGGVAWWQPWGWLLSC